MLIVQFEEDVRFDDFALHQIIGYLTDASIQISELLHGHKNNTLFKLKGHRRVLIQFGDLVHLINTESAECCQTPVPTSGCYQQQWRSGAV